MHMRRLVIVLEDDKAQAGLAMNDDHFDQ